MINSNKFFKGTALLSLAAIFTKILSMLYRIPLGILTNNIGYGYYTTIYPYFLVITAFLLIGIPQALSKIVSEKNANNQEENAYAYFKIALLIQILCGAALVIYLMFFAKMIIKNNGWHQNAIYVLYGLSFSPIFIGISGTIRGYYQGKQVMAPTAISQFIEGFIKAVIGIGLVFILLRLGYSIPIATGGAAFGTSIGFVVSACYLSYVFKKDNTRCKVSLKNYNIKGILADLIWMSIPIALGASIVSIINGIDSITMYNQLGAVGFNKYNITEITGMIGKAFSIVNVPLAISMAIMMSTLPAISEVKEEKDKKLIIEASKRSIKFAMIIAFPSAIGLGVLSQPITKLVFRSTSGSVYLQIICIGLAFLIMGQTIVSILQGLGYQWMPVITILISVSTKLIINNTLIKTDLLEMGALIGTIVAYIIFAVLNYIFLKKVTNIKSIFKTVLIKPLIASSIMGIIVYIGYNILIRFLPITSLVTLFIIALGGCVYLILLVATKAVTEEELKILPKQEKVIYLLKKIRVIG